MTQDGRTARQALGAYGERVAAQHLEAAGLEVHAVAAEPSAEGVADAVTRVHT